jgi:hypothetical protein
MSFGRWIRLAKGLAPSLLAATLTLVPGAPARALSNAGFESGNFSGWSTVGDVGVVGSEIGRAPTEGSFQALLSNARFSVSGAVLESALGLAPGSLFAACGNCDPGLPPSQQVTEGSAITQTFTTGGGQQLAFDASFITEEARNGSASINDFAFFVLSGATDVIFDTFSPMEVGLNLSIPAIGVNTPYEASYQTFVYDVSAPGTYSIAFGVVDVKDVYVNTVLLVDNLRFVPEPPIDPPTATLVGFGLIAVISAARRRWTP